MSEKSEKTKKALIQNADKITIAVLAIILLGLGYAWWQEQNSEVGKADTNGKPAVFQDKLAESPSLEMLQNMSTTPDIASAPGALRLAQFSMFDNKTMEQERAAETQAKAQVAQAKTLIDQDKKDEARALLESAIKIAYTPDAVKLLDSVTTPTAAAPAGEPGADMSATDMPQ